MTLRERLENARDKKLKRKRECATIENRMRNNNRDSRYRLTEYELQTQINIAHKRIKRSY